MLFKPGNIVSFKGKPYTAALPGAMALVVLGNSNGYDYVTVFWLDSLSKNQCNGEYMATDFDLAMENFKSYRPDIRPEHRCSDPAESLKAAVEFARASGMTVECKVSTTVMEEI